MTLAQSFRRLIYRARAMLFGRGADNEPIVEAEGAPFDPPPSALRQRIDRYLRMAGGFAASVIVLGAIALFALEVGSRPELDIAPTIPAPEKASQTIAAARYLFELRSAQETGVGADRIFTTPAMRRRERNIAIAAEDVAAYVIVDHLTARRGARDELLANARDLAETDNPERTTALERLNAAIARDQIRLDHSVADFRKLALEAAASLAARAVTLAEFTPPDRSDAAFAAARGEAYAWLLILRAAAADSGDAALLDDPAYARTIESLERAAARRPILFLRAPSGGLFAPNYLSEIGLDLAIASQEARALGAAR